jgi:predicted TIM-barrel fold metal-dependent hydrolase
MEKQKDRRSFVKCVFSSAAVVPGFRLASNIGESPSFGEFSSAQSKNRAKMKRIAVEEHFYSKEFLNMLHSKTEWKGSPAASAATKVLEYGEGRIREMDGTGIDMQILSLSYPAIDAFKTADAIEVAKMINDQIAEAVKAYPKRFSGYCCIPLQDPNAAVDEMERAITRLGLKAVMVNENTPERWLSDQKYEVVFDRLAKLDVPMYLHADGPSTEDSGLHVVPEVMRLINGTLLDKYPKLQFILGHGGESLPFWLNRLDGRWRQPERPKIFSQYFRDNFCVSTSSQCWPVLLQFLISSIGSDRILFATDYPYESTKQHVDFIETAAISDSDREKICHLNAERLFKL